MESIKKLLRSRGIEPSFQRIKIYQYLQDEKNHPTVNMIYKDLIKEIPTLSRTTVYNNLKLFARKGMVICLNGKVDRYDANTNFHGHFICRRCGDIYDFAVESINTDFNEGKIEERYVKYIGVCRECQNKER